MYVITTADGRKVEVDCIACAISKNEVQILGGIIAESEYFQVSNDFEYPIPGFLIINSKRHVRGIGDFTEEEAADFGLFLGMSE